MSNVLVNTRLPAPPGNVVPPPNAAMISNFDNLMQQFIDSPYGRGQMTTPTNNPITAITQTNPAVITISAARVGFRSNTSIDYYGYLKDVGGCTDLNGMHYQSDKKRLFWMGTPIASSTKCVTGREFFGSFQACGHARANSTAYTAGTAPANTIVVLASDSKYHVYKCTTSGTTAASQPGTYVGTALEVITDGTAVFTEITNTGGTTCADKIIIYNYPSSMSAGMKFAINISNWSGTFNASEGGAPSGTNGIKTVTDVISTSMYTFAYDSVTAGEPAPSGVTIVSHLLDSSGMPAYTSGGNVHYLAQSETDTPSYDGTHFWYTWTDYYNLDWSFWTAADLWGRPTYKDFARHVAWHQNIEKNMSDTPSNSPSRTKTNGIDDQWLVASASENRIADWDTPTGGLNPPMAGPPGNRRFVHGAYFTDVFTTAQKKAICFAAINGQYYREASFVGAGLIGETTLVGVTKYSDMTGHGGVNTSIMPSGDANSPSWANTRECAYQLIANVYFERLGGARITDSAPSAGWVRVKEMAKFLHDSHDWMRTRTFPESGVQQGRQRVAPFYHVLNAWALIEIYEWESTRSGGNWPALWAYMESTLSFQDWLYQHMDWIHNQAPVSEINAANFHFTVVSADATHITLDASASAVDSTYVDSYVRDDANQKIYYISAYVGSTKTLTISSRSTGGDGRPATAGSMSPVPTAGQTLTIGNPPNIVTETMKLRVPANDGRLDLLYESQFNGTVGDAPYAFWGNGTVYRGLNIMQAYPWAWLANEYKVSNPSRAITCAAISDQYFDSCVFDYNASDITTSGNAATVSYAKNFTQVFFFGLKARQYRLAAST